MLIFDGFFWQMLEFWPHFPLVLVNTLSILTIALKSAAIGSLSCLCFLCGSCSNNLYSIESTTLAPQPPDVIRPTSSPAKKPKPGSGADPSKPKARKAKEIRREKARLKGKAEKPQQQQMNKETSLEELTEFFMRGDQSKNCHNFSIRLVRATDDDPEFERTFDESFKVYQKYQVCTNYQVTKL